MVFPFFGKKSTGKPDAEKAGNRMPAPRRVQPPPRPAAPEAPAPTPPEPVLDQPLPKEELPDLDFTVSGVELNISVDETQRIELREGSSRVHPVVEEAAILFANGGTEQAVQVLEGAIERDTLGGDAEQVWSLLFELYQVLDRREAFDQRTLDFVVRFEKSPPTWVDARVTAAAGAAAAPVCNLSGALSAANGKQFEQMHRIVAKNKLVRLDLGKVGSADADGCAYINELVGAARRIKHKLALQNADALVKLLNDRIGIGRRDNQPMWLLLLEILQQQGNHEAFEELALNYAITFEVSPPSWEQPGAQAQDAAKDSAPGNAQNSDIFPLSGELLGPCTNVHLLLHAFGEAHDTVVVDMAQVKRMDFVSAGMMLNTVAELAGRGKTVRLANVSNLVAALLSVVGVNHVARIERRRT